MAIAFANCRIMVSCEQSLAAISKQSSLDLACCSWRQRQKELSLEESTGLVLEELQRLGGSNVCLFLETQTWKMTSKVEGEA